MISSKQTAVFFWQSIGAALVDGINREFTKSAKSSRAEPEEKKSLSGEKSFQLKYFMISATHLKNELNNRENLTINECF